MTDAPSMAADAPAPGPLHLRCERCGKERPLDRRRHPTYPAAVRTISVPRCGPCGGGFDQPEAWLDAAGRDLVPY